MRCPPACCPHLLTTQLDFATLESLTMCTSTCLLPLPSVLTGPRRQRGTVRPQAANNGSSSGGRLVLEPQQRAKLDMRADSDFYAMPRFVHHLDANFRAQLTQLIRERIPEGAAVLDLCSSW